MALALVLVGSIELTGLRAAPVLAAAGDLDAGFGNGGTMTTAFTSSGGTTVGYGVAVQPDGRIVAVGRASDQFALARYNPDGSLDPSFGGNGIVLGHFFRDDVARAVAIQPDGKIVVAGTGTRVVEPVPVPAPVPAPGPAAMFDSNFRVARYNPDGSLDPGFGGNGTATTDFADFGGQEAELRAMALQSDGKIVVAGTTVVNQGYNFALARFDADGSLDPSFGGDGKVITDFGGSGGEASAVAVQADGKIVAAGVAFTSTNDFGLVRYNPDGTPDISFGGDGKVTTDFGVADKDEEASAVALQADGKIVAAGLTEANGRNDFALLRYNPDGSLDPSFGGDGRVTTDFGGGEWARAVAIQADGKIVAVGTRGDLASGHSDFALARYRPDGSLDRSFSRDGTTTTDFGDNNEANAVAIQGDGAIVAAGSVGGPAGTPYQGTAFALARYRAN